MTRNPPPPRRCSPPSPSPAAAAGRALPAAPSAGDATTALGVRAVKPHAGSARVTRATGELRARHEATLSAETSGRIQRFLVDVGARVKKGDVLVELDASTARIQVQQAQAARAAAEAAHKGAESDLRRARELARGDAASPAAVERAETVELQTAAALQQAAAAVAAAQDQLAKHTLRAPFDGVITARTKSAGEFVAMMPPTAGARDGGPRLARGPRRSAGGGRGPPRAGRRARRDGEPVRQAVQGAHPLGRRGGRAGHAHRGRARRPGRRAAQGAAPRRDRRDRARRRRGGGGAVPPRRRGAGGGRRPVRVDRRGRAS